MKKMKRMTGAILVMILTLSVALGGCGKKATPENLFGDIVKNFEKTESTSSNLKIEMEVSVMGMSGTVGMDMDIDTITKPYACKILGTVDADMAGENMSMDMEVYQVEEKEKLMTYLCTDGLWDTSEEDIEDKTDMANPQAYLALQKDAEKFTLEEESSKVNGKECFRLKGEISGENLFALIDGELMDSMGAGELIDMDEIKSESFPCTIDIYKDKILPAALSFDMKNMMNGIEGADSYGMEIDKYLMTLTMNEYNSVKKIEVPKEALEN